MSGMKRNRAVFSALLVMLLWGSLFPMVKLGYSAYGISTTGDILLFAGVRFTVCGGLICLGQLAVDRRGFQGVTSAWGGILLSGLFAVILHYSFTYLGLGLTDSSKTAILKQVGALF